MTGRLRVTDRACLGHCRNQTCHCRGCGPGPVAGAAVAGAAAAARARPDPALAVPVLHVQTQAARLLLRNKVYNIVKYVLLLKHSANMYVKYVKYSGKI